MPKNNLSLVKIYIQKEWDSSLLWLSEHLSFDFSCPNRPTVRMTVFTRLYGSLTEGMAGLARASGSLQSFAANK